MSRIVITDGNDSIKLLAENNNISLRTIKNYFPSASGLIYYDRQKEKCGLEIKNEMTQLVPRIITYETFYATPFKSKYIVYLYSVI